MEKRTQLTEYINDMSVSMTVEVDHDDDEHPFGITFGNQDDGVWVSLEDINRLSRLLTAAKRIAKE